MTHLTLWNHRCTDHQKGRDKHYLCGWLGAVRWKNIFEWVHQMSQLWKKQLSAFTVKEHFYGNSFLSLLIIAGLSLGILERREDRGYPKENLTPSLNNLSLTLSHFLSLSLCLCPLQVIFSSALGVPTSCSATDSGLTRPNHKYGCIATLDVFTYVKESTNVLQ